MIKQTIVWTLLPDPAAEPTAVGTVPLSLVLSIRLSNDEGDPPGTAVLPLSRYTDIAAWPNFAFTLSVIVKKPDGTSVTTPATLLGGPPDTALWYALFPASMLVRPFVFDSNPAGQPLQSYPHLLVAYSLREEYARLFTTGPAPRSGTAGGQQVAPRDGHVTPDRWADIDRLTRLVGAREGSGSGPSPYEALMRSGVVGDSDGRDPAGWTRLADFHRPLTPTAGEETRIGHGTTPQSEFHTLQAALADHSGLAVPIGLIRRISIALPAGLEGPVSLQAVPQQSTFIENYRPRTRCIAHAGTLTLARENGTAGALFLPLDDTTVYTPYDFDVDAGGLALQSYANTLRGLPRTEEPPPVLQPPALRSDGIIVAESDRQISFQALLVEAANIDADLAAGGEGDATTLHAGNVQQGIRVDVLDQGSGRWYPLCARVGAYHVDGYTGSLPIDDEGTLTDAVTRGTDAQGNPVMRLAQALFRWNNWSLVTEPYGRTLGIDGQLTDPEPQKDPDLPYSFSVTTPAGSLPTLRYGRSYRFRARLVDLAGRAVPFTGTPAPDSGEPATVPLTYARYEPVPAPVLVLRRPVDAGESPTDLVVRTDNADPAAVVPGDTCERHLLAPKAAVLLLERHGVLDAPGTHRPDPAVHSLLTQYDGGRITGTPDPGAGGSPYLDTDAMSLPWLPDPLCRGIALHGVPDTPELLTTWPPGGSWYQRLPMRLVIEPGPPGTTQSTATVDLAARVVRVTLSPAASFPATLSALLSAGDEEVLGLWRWFAESPGRPADEIAAARAAALSGSVAQLTPATGLTMVHAVRCPVDPPGFGGVRILREPGETAYAVDDPAMSVHGASTLSVHAEAWWNEIVDDLSRDQLTTTPARAVLRPDADGLGDPGGPLLTATAFRARHDPGDTRHRVIQYTPVGTSRFVPYFTRRSTVTLSGTAPADVAAAFVPGTVVVRAAVPPLTPDGTPAAPGTTYSLERDVTVDDGAGQVARVDGGAIPDGASVDVAFAVPPVTRSGTTSTLHVPSTVRPPVPVVHSAVPAFAWQQTQAGGVITSIRQAGTVRVHLRRPWYASGEGELLAVRVLDPAAQPDPAAGEWATTWGRDPVRDPGDAPVLDFPRPADLVQAIDVPLAQGHAMGYPVEYDADRQLWYADVQFAGQTTYQPFVNLKVIRLQPDSLLDPEDLRASSTVDAGYVQLPAFRRSKVTVGGTVIGSPVTVTVVGPAPPPGRDGLTSEFSVVVQIRSTSLTDDIGWITLDTFPPITMDRDPIAGVIGIWRKTVQLPAAVGDRAMRVVIQEYDVQPDSPVTGQTSRRISFLDTISI
ncbi:hypothetical protein ACIODT_09760 [Streptomyces sp. NPDC088251]|uniref:hypothetical protein n=1 Tax=unclassified Streptomyces TaxID=2593676 RepID=UPI003814A59F